MPKMKSSSGQADLIELAMAGIDAQIKALTEKREELRAMLAPAPEVKERKQAAPARKVAARKVAARKVVARKVTARKVTAKKVADAAPAKKKRVFSAATRKKLREAAKARWARQKAAAKPE